MRYRLVLAGSWRAAKRPGGSAGAAPAEDGYEGYSGHSLFLAQFFRGTRVARGGPLSIREAQRRALPLVCMPLGQGAVAANLPVLE